MTTKTNLATPAYNSPDWNTPLNSNFNALNDALGNSESVAIAAADVTLTTAQAQKMRIVVSGTLLTNRTLFLPAGASGFWIVTNATTGAFSVTVKNVSGTISTDVTQGTSALLCSDGVNTFPASNSPTTGAVPAGTFIDFAGVAAPPGYLLCDGAAVSRTYYVVLFAAIGTTWGAGDGSTTFNLPDVRGYFRRAAGTNSDGTVGTAVGSTQADIAGPHTHTITDPGHTHIESACYSSNDRYPGNNGNGQPGSGTTGPSITNIVINNSGTGIGTETRPKNKGALVCIKY